MPIVPNRYNDPNLGIAFNNIASLFAPPAAGDVAAYADAAVKKQRFQNIADLIAAAKSGTDPAQFDRLNQALGNYAYSQGREAVAMGDATDRRGQDFEHRDRVYSTDVGAQTQRYGYDQSRIANIYGSQAQLAGKLSDPVGESEISRGLDPQMAAALRLPAVAPLAGPVKPLSEDQLKAIILGRLPEDTQNAVAFGSTPVENVVGADGKPVVSTRLGAIGKQPVLTEAASGKTAVYTALYPDGRRVPAFLPAGARAPVDASGAPLPQGYEIMEPSKATGTLSDVTPSTLTTGARTDAQIGTQAIDMAVLSGERVLEKLRENPGALGAVGWARRNVQDLIQSGDEAAISIGKGVADTIKRAEAAGVDAGFIGEKFDPGLPATQAAINLFVWNYASALSGDRVSNEQFNKARDALGLDGLLANNASAMAKINEALAGLKANRQYKSDVLVDGVPSATPNAPVSTGDPEGDALLQKYGVQ